MRYPSDKHHRQWKLAILYMIASILAVPAGFCFDPSKSSTSDEHADIVKQALYDVLSPGNLSFLQKAVAYQSQQSEPRRHFMDVSLDKSKAYIDRESKVSINYASDADGNVRSRERALMHLGFLMHTAEDFYCKSNFLELNIEAINKKGATIDPYTADLVDWNKLADYPELQVTAEFDKGSLETTEGRKKSGSVNYHDAARAMAIRETQRQWNLFEALVRRRYPGRATTIMTAFKTASCPDVDLKSLSTDLP